MNTSDYSCNDDKDIDGASKSNDDNVCEVNMLQNMSTADEDDIISVCANCGKEGSDINNICNKCKQVNYCNAACKKKHRHKHKADCERRVAELHDKELFKEPPLSLLHEDCPICFLRMPTMDTGHIYYTCCGKVVCTGCVQAPLYDNQGNEVDNKKCPYCRAPWHDTNEEEVQRVKKRVDLDDPIAMYNFGVDYQDGTCGFPQDYTKALELFHRSGDIGYAESYNNIGYAYERGEGVEVDMKKAKHFYELAAIGGDVFARHNLGIDEVSKGNIDRALKHYLIAVRNGKTDSLEEIRELYSAGHATKDDYTKALQAYQVYLGEIKSDQRDKAAATYEQCRYY